MTIPVFRRPPVLVLETDVNPVVAGGRSAGWVTGTPALLADGASVNIIFDLGPDWDQYVIAAFNVRPQGGQSLSGIQCTGSNTVVPDTTRRLKEVGAGAPSNTNLTISTASDGNQFYVRPCGRFLTVTVTNTATFGAQTAASKVVATIFPA
jgi:hypothetical protein